MQQSIRVRNIRKYPIGISLQNGREYNIRPGGFVQLTQDEIEWLASIAPALFQDEKQLRVEDRDLAVELTFVDSPDFQPLDDAQIRKLLGQSATKVKAWLDTIDEPYLLDAIYEISITMDLPSTKLKILQEKMPSREFLTTDGE